MPDVFLGVISKTDTGLDSVVKVSSSSNATNDEEEFDLDD